MLSRSRSEDARLQRPDGRRRAAMRPAVWLVLVTFSVQLGKGFATSTECPRWLGLSSGAIQDWQIAASSHWTGGINDGDSHHHHHGGRITVNNNSNNCQAKLARLHHNKGWCAKHRAAGEWVLVDLGVVSQVTGILTQGREPDAFTAGDGHHQGDWVTAYSLSYSVDAFKWGYVSSDSGIRRVFRGNNDASTVRYNQLDPPLTARFIRLHVLEWRGRPSIRMEIVGCQECNQIITESAHVRLSASTSSSVSSSRKQQQQHHQLTSPFSCQPEGAHLYSHSGWCAKKNDAEQWLQFDVGPPRLVTGVVTRGHGGGGNLPAADLISNSKQHHRLVQHIPSAASRQAATTSSSSWVTSYTISYSNDSLLWFSYRDGNHLDAKIFGGNADKETERRHYLNQPFSARFIRIHPRSWHGGAPGGQQMGLRAALLGCPWKAGQDCGPGFFSLHPISGCQENLAYHRTTWLNDKRHLWKDWKYGRASLAVDGDTDPTLHRCAILDNYFVDHPVWMVDLGRKHSINGVIIFTWQGKGQDKTATYRDYQSSLERLTVYVSNKPRLESADLLGEPVCGSAVGMSNRTGRSSNETSTSVATVDLFQPRVHIPCAGGEEGGGDLRGRYVYVRAIPAANRRARLFFSVLCEVMVY